MDMIDERLTITPRFLQKEVTCTCNCYHANIKQNISSELKVNCT